MTDTPTDPRPAWGTGDSILDVRGPSQVGAAHDRAAAAEALHRYVWANDERRFDVLADCLTENVKFNGSVGGRAEIPAIEGRDTMVALCRDLASRDDFVRRHNVVNVVVDDLDDKSATVVANVIVTSVRDGSVRIDTTGFYRARVVKEPDGAWRIAAHFTGVDLPVL